MRRTAAFVSALVMLVGVLLTGAGSPAQASYQVNTHVGIRMLDVNRVIVGCHNYPVEYVVGNVAVDTNWEVELFIAETVAGEALVSVGLYGTGPEAGRKQFRICSNAINGGRYKAFAYYTECSPGGSDSSCLSRPFEIASGLRQAAVDDFEYASITTLFKRTSSVRVWMSPRDPARGAPVTIRGNLRLEGVDGKMRFVGGRLIKLYGKKGPTSPYTYIATVRTDPTGEYRLALSHRRSFSYLAVYQGSPAYFPCTRETNYAIAV